MIDPAFAIATDRLLLRQWHDRDREPFAAMNADPAVMQYFPAPLTRVESDRLFDLIQQRWLEQGFGLFAVEQRTTSDFIGFIGLHQPSFQAWFTPCVEIGWRLVASAHGQGLATEGARAVVQHASGVLGLPELVSFTTVENRASRRVMEKLGMQYIGEFEHPSLPAGHPLRPHALYRISFTSDPLPASPD